MGIRDQLKETFNTKNQTFLIVKDSKDMGLETYINPNINQFPKPYKDQLISFLESALKQLKEKKR